MTKIACAWFTLALAVPRPIDAQSLADYPPAALRDHKEGTTVISVTVDTAGRAKNCVVTQSSGSSDLDAESCRIFVRRGQFSPAKDRNGQPIESIVSSTVHWKLPN